MTTTTMTTLSRLAGRLHLSACGFTRSLPRRRGAVALRGAHLHAFFSVAFWPPQARSPFSRLNGSLCLSRQFG